MQIYKKILVTMDCSPVDKAILDHVMHLAVQNKANMILLHVVHSHTLDQDRTLRQKAEKILSGYIESLQKNGVEASLLLRSGEPETEILAEIEKEDYDLVAMGIHGHNFVLDAILGSVSRSIKHKIRIPLLLLRG
ncbi:MAG: universal stress protein [Calditrichaceae bacterium]|jgi:nucleotide-binding universal stress UspA family protein